MMTVRMTPISTVLGKDSSGFFIAEFPPYVVVPSKKHSALLGCFNCFAVNFSVTRALLGLNPGRWQALGQRRAGPKAPRLRWSRATRPSALR